MTDHYIFVGQLSFHAIVPLLNVDVRLGLNQMSKAGVGDLNLATALG